MQAPISGVSRRTFVAGLIFSTGAAASMWPVAAAGQRLDLAQANPQPLRIALPDFVASAEAVSETARALTQIIRTDLAGSGAFALIDPAALAGSISGVDSPPRFEDLRAGDVQALVIGRLRHEEDGGAVVQFRLWDVAAGQQLTGYQYRVGPAKWPALAHLIAATIYERLTGQTRSFE